MATTQMISRGSRQALAQTLRQLCEMLEASEQHETLALSEMESGLPDRASTHRARARALRQATITTMRDVAVIVGGG